MLMCSPKSYSVLKFSKNNVPVKGATAIRKNIGKVWMLMKMETIFSPPLKKVDAIIDFFLIRLHYNFLQIKRPILKRCLLQQWPVR